MILFLTTFSSVQTMMSASKMTEAQILRKMLTDEQSKYRIHHSAGRTDNPNICPRIRLFHKQWN